MPETLGHFYLGHINDTHSHFDEISLPLRLPLSEGPVDIRLKCGGFPRLAAFYRAAREKATASEPFILLDAGDSFQGTLYFTRFQGQANADLMNRLGVDAMVIGNHELDTGNSALANFLNQVQFPLLAANWDLSTEPLDKSTRMHGHPLMVSYQNPAHPKPYILKSVGKQQVAIFGLVLENMPEIAAPDPDSTFLPVVQTAKTIVQELHEQGIAHIILLSHLGYERDCRLAGEVSGLSMIVGGHTHTLQGDFGAIGLANQHAYGEPINGTIVLQAGYNSLMAGLARVALLPNGQMQIESGANVLLTSDDAMLLSQQGEVLTQVQEQYIRSFLKQQPNVVSVQPDPTMERHLNQRYRYQLSEFSSDQVVSLPQGLRHVRIPDARGGSQVAPLVAEAMLHEARLRGVPIDIAIFNAGGARISLPPGPVSAADLAGRLLPFASKIAHFGIRGSQLRLALEGAIINALELGGSGSFPYPANLRFHYDDMRPRGERVQQILIKNEDGEWLYFDEQRDYRLITTSYTAMGKEGYDALLNDRSEPELLGPIISDAFINFARAKGVLLPPNEPLYDLNLRNIYK